MAESVALSNISADRHVSHEKEPSAQQQFYIQERRRSFVLRPSTSSRSFRPFKRSCNDLRAVTISIDCACKYLYCGLWQHSAVSCFMCR